MSGKDGTKPFDGYVRVSRVNGREGESYRSPGDQREAIESLARMHGLRVGEVVVEEDVSGGKKADDRELGRLVAKVEAGESAGLLVWRVSRFSRNMADGVLTAARIRDAGGRIIGTDLDTDAPMGKALLGFLMGWAEEEKDQRAAGWRRAVDGAVARGVYVGPTPVGFDRLEDGRLRKNGDAEAVARAFAVRAGGGSWSEVCRSLDRAGVRTATGQERWGINSARSLLSHPIYKGLLKNGHEHHEPAYAVVTQALWERAQRKGDGPRPGRKDGGSWALLAGMLRCEGCGHRMAPTTTTTRGKKYRYYQCKHLPCTAKAQVAVDAVEPWLLEQAASYFEAAVESGEFSTGRDVDPERVSELEEAVADAQRRRDRALLSSGVADETLAELEAEVEAAKAALTEELGASRVTVTPGEFRAALAEAGLDERRHLVRTVVSSAVVRRGKENLEERVDVGYRTLVW